MIGLFTSGLKLVKQKTLYHLLHFGKWSEFTIRIPRGKVQLYYEGGVNPLFEWEHPDLASSFSPVYYYYKSEYGNAIGVAFDCNSSMYFLVSKYSSKNLRPIDINFNLFTRMSY